MNTALDFKRVTRLTTLTDFKTLKNPHTLQVDLQNHSRERSVNRHETDRMCAVYKAITIEKNYTCIDIPWTPFRFAMFSTIVTAIGKPRANPRAKRPR